MCEYVCVSLYANMYDVCMYECMSVCICIYKYILSIDVWPSSFTANAIYGIPVMFANKVYKFSISIYAFVCVYAAHLNIYTMCVCLCVWVSEWASEWERVYCAMFYIYMHYRLHLTVENGPRAWLKARGNERDRMLVRVNIILFSTRLYGASF